MSGNVELARLRTKLQSAIALIRGISAQAGGAGLGMYARDKLLKAEQCLYAVSELRDPPAESDQVVEPDDLPFMKTITLDDLTFDDRDILVVRGIRFAGHFFSALGQYGIEAGRLLQIVHRSDEKEPVLSIWPDPSMEYRATLDRAVPPNALIKPGFYWRRVVDGTPAIEPEGGPFPSEIDARADVQRQSKVRNDLNVGDDFNITEWVQILPENYADDQIDMAAFIGVLNARLAADGMQAADCQFSWRDEDSARKDLARLMREFIRVEVHVGGFWLKKCATTTVLTVESTPPMPSEPQEDAK